MTDQTKRITIDAPSEMVILAARHLDATEGPVQVGRLVDSATRSAITTVLRYVAKAHNTPQTAPAEQTEARLAHLQTTSEAAGILLTRTTDERDQLRRERDGINRMYLAAMGDLGIAANRLDNIRALATGARDHSAAGIDDYQIGRHDLAVDVLAALDKPASGPQPAWAPPPPGDRREQLPDTVLAPALAHMRAYQSTACDTAGALELATLGHPEQAAELRSWAERMHHRCRLTHKFTGTQCVCACHQPKEPTP